MTKLTQKLTQCIQIVKLAPHHQKLKTKMQKYFK